MGVLMTLLVLLRVARGSRARTPAERRQLGTATLAGLAVRELGAVQREREGQGWTPELLDRALAATRVAAAAAIGRPISQRATDTAVQAGEGRLITRGARRGTHRIVSAAATASDLERAAARLAPGDARASMLERLQAALRAFTAAGYSRDPASATSDLDSALTSALDAAREVRAANAWPRRLLRRGGGLAAPVETQA
jgi:hypothetical protein